jgi:tetratricopeptide (TPR) repeat protein
MRRIVTFFAALFAVSLIAAGALAGLVHSASRASTNAGSSDQFGKVNFPTSCSPQAQPAIEKGVAQLHSFQYQQSEAAFTEATQTDSQCGIAYWGRAMSLYHQLWDFPDADTLAKGGGYAAEAQKLAAKTARETDYIAGAAAFYQDNSKLSHTARVEAYAAAMEKLHRDFPEDTEGAAFYALSLVNLAYHEDELVNRKKAIAILDPLFEQHPENPGVAHYLIHATDTPELAPQGLAAARRYAQIAPDSSHAIHMPSHIFVRLGLWQESIDSNISAAGAAAEATAAHLADSNYQFHAMDFLNYSYLQSGQEAKARQVIADLKSVTGGSASDIAEHQAWSLARTALESRHWKEAAALPVQDAQGSPQDSIYFARAVGSARSGDVQGARAAIKKLKEEISSASSHARHMGYGSSSGQSIEQQEAQAWLKFAEGKSEEAVKILRAAADREDAAGVDSLTMPAREMLGDLLLELKRPSESLEAYRTALKESPNRFDALWGAAQAAQSAGDASAAKSYYAKLVEVSGPGADRPELQEARGYLASK